jgi:2-polyprenyl-6-methoxyphenol hydroxylase-like FAD-dependent oxidoreductase
MPTWLADGKTHAGGAQGLPELKEIGTHLAEPWKSSLLWIPDNTDVTCNSVSYWPIIRWDSCHGTITLEGDSAHPEPPHRGQGLNHAIADVSGVVKAVVEVRDGGKGREVAVEEYNAEVVKRREGVVMRWRLVGGMRCLCMILRSLWSRRCSSRGMQS